MNSSPKILPITTEALPHLQNILSQSAGYDIAIADELEYFDPAHSKNWFFAQDLNQRPIGLVRSFAQNTEWSLAEFYVEPGILDRPAVAATLLEAFQRASAFPAGHRVRFDIPASDHELNKVLLQTGFSQKEQTFKHFEYPLANTASPQQLVDISTARAADVAEVLSHLHPVTESEAEAWLKNGSLRLGFHEGVLVSVAQVYDVEKSLEINRIATHANYLRQSHGEKLIEQVLGEAKQKAKDSVFLKVEDGRAPAISLYKKMGFHEIKSKEQIWHSRWY